MTERDMAAAILLIESDDEVCPGFAEPIEEEDFEQIDRLGGVDLMPWAEDDEDEVWHFQPRQWEIGRDGRLYFAEWDELAETTVLFVVNEEA